MRSTSIAVSVAILAALLSWSGTPAYGGHGGDGGGHSFGAGGFSGFSGGSRGYSGGFGGYNGGGHTYGGMRVYTGGGFGRIYNSYGSYLSQRSGGYHNYGPHLSARTWTSGGHPFSSSLNSSGYVNHRQFGVNRTDRYAGTDPIHNQRINPALQRGSTGLMSKQITTRDGKTYQGNWSQNNPANKNRFDRQTQDKLRNWQGKKSNWAEANQRHHENHDGDHHHDRDWWHHHCNAIILVDWGWWGWWDGWWYPAWGYDPYYSYYEYDGPIYGYNGLPPDEVVANVQSELQRLGYYSYAVDGVLGPLMQEALSRYQRDHGLPITGTIDPETVGSLGLAW